MAIKPKTFCKSHFYIWPIYRNRNAINTFFIFVYRRMCVFKDILIPINFVFSWKPKANDKLGPYCLILEVISLCGEFSGGLCYNKAYEWNESKDNPIYFEIYTYTFKLLVWAFRRKDFNAHFCRIEYWIIGNI